MLFFEPNYDIFNIAKLEELVCKIYNTSSVLKSYCDANPDDIKQISNLSTVIDYVHKDIDVLTCIILD